MQAVVEKPSEETAPAPVAAANPENSPVDEEPKAVEAPKQDDIP